MLHKKLSCAKGFLCFRIGDQLPICGHQQIETMPVDACRFFYTCVGCRTMLTPKEGDCSVFCSYGSMKCLPMQAGTVHCVRFLIIPARFLRDDFRENPERTEPGVPWVSNCPLFKVPNPCYFFFILFKNIYGIGNKMSELWL